MIFPLLLIHFELSKINKMRCEKQAADRKISQRGQELCMKILLFIFLQTLTLITEKL